MIDLPPALHGKLTDRFAPRGPAQPVDGGFTPGLRFTIPTDAGRLFVKATRHDSSVAAMYRIEATVNKALPTGPWPPLLADWEEDGWVTLVFEHVPGRNPDLSPGSPDLERVARAVTSLHDRLTPCPLPNVADFAESPVVERAAEHHDAMRGETLLHCDIRADNLLIDGGVRLVDWALAHRGAPWLDAALMVPQLLMCGHTPEQAEKWAGQIPAYRNAPGEAVTAFASSLTSYWADRQHDGVPALRAYRARAHQAGCAWVQHRSGERI